MKKKALIIGALPSPFEGPWVTIDDHNTWRVVMGHDYGSDVLIEFLNGDPSQRSGPVGDLLINCAKARAKIVEFPNVPHVSVWLEAVNGEV